MAPHICHKMVIRVKTPHTSTILGMSNINLEFETVASEFAKPTREDFLDGVVEFDYAQSPFNRVFSMLRQMMQLEENAGDRPTLRPLFLNVKTYSGFSHPYSSWAGPLRNMVVSVHIVYILDEYVLTSTSVFCFLTQISVSR